MEGKDFPPRTQSSQSCDLANPEILASNLLKFDFSIFKPELLPVPQDCGQMCSLGSFCLEKIEIIRKIS